MKNFLKKKWNFFEGLQSKKVRATEILLARPLFIGLVSVLYYQDITVNSSLKYIDYMVIVCDSEEPKYVWRQSLILYWVKG